MPIEYAEDLILPACHALAQSLTQDPFYRAITVEAEDETGRAVLLARYFGLAIAEAEGCAIWITNEAGPAQARQCSERRNAALWPLLGQRGYDRYARICENMAARAPAYLNEAWYLSILGVRPAARGKGLAAELLAPTLARADAHRATCYLETFNPLSLPFYRRAGFAQEVPLFEDLTGTPYWLLVRTAH